MNIKALSALALFSQKPPRREGQAEEEANAQAAVQKKKHETEVQVNLLDCAPMEAKADIKKARGQGP